MITPSFGAVRDEWSQFRGPNASGVAGDPAEIGLPVHFGPSRNVIWKTPLPPGHSSPVLTATRIFVTAYAPDKLLVICLDRAQGKVLWRREVPKPRAQELHRSNSPASPSPVTDGQNVYAFFTDYGLISFDRDGRERWRMPLGPFNNSYGMGASPILAEDEVLLNCDSETNSFLIAVDQNTGRVRWRVARPEALRGFSTPVLYRPPKGPAQVIVAGSFKLSAYEVATGKEVWWIRGLTWQIRPTPVLERDRLYILGFAREAEPVRQEAPTTFAQALKRYDRNGDGKLGRNEVADPYIIREWTNFDLNRDNALDEGEWRVYRSILDAQNGLLAYRIDLQRPMRGDLTKTHFLWRYQKSLPVTPSPLLYRGALYLIKEGGLLTALNPANGAVLKQGRLREAPGDYYSSPVAADGKIYTVSEEGKVTVIKVGGAGETGGDWQALATNDLNDSCHATPAIAGGKIYLRTQNTLYCFGARERANFNN
jgi:outer membrane protein assembly factor BamB